MVAEQVCSLVRKHKQLQNHRIPKFRLKEGGGMVAEQVCSLVRKHKQLQNHRGSKFRLKAGLQNL
jgi:hypothetical protein